MSRRVLSIVHAEDAAHLPRKGSGMTKTEMLALDVSFPMLVAAKAYCIGKTLAYQLTERDEFPIPVRKVGGKLICFRRHLLADFGYDD